MPCRDWPEPRHQLGQVGRRQASLADDPEIGRRQPRHRLEVVEDMIRRRRNRGTADIRGPLPDIERVAIGRCPRDPRAGDGAGGAADILDQHGLPERRLHVVGDDARHRVGRPAGRKADDDRDRLRRIACACAGAAQTSAAATAAIGDARKFTGSIPPVGDGRWHDLCRGRKVSIAVAPEIGLINGRVLTTIVSGNPMKAHDRPMIACRSGSVRHGPCARGTW